MAFIKKVVEEDKEKRKDQVRYQSEEDAGSTYFLDFGAA
jgi:hypothetical protein